MIWSHSVKMELQFVIFVVSATLTQNCFAQQQSTAYGLSEDQSTQFQTIENKEKATYGTVFGGMNPIFDVLVLLALARKYNLQSGSLDSSTLMAGATAEAVNSINHVFTAIPITVGRSCAAAETGQIAGRGHLQNVYTQVGSAVQLALSGTATDIRTQFEPLSDAMKVSLAKFVEEYFAALRACAQISNADALAAIQAQETQTRDNVLNAGNIVFDAIKVVANWIHAASSTTDIVADIERYRKRAASKMKNSVEHSYTPLRGIHISNNLNKPELAANIMADQLALIRSTNRYKAVAALILDLIKSYLNKVKLGLSEGCHGDDSAINAAQAEAAANFKAALHALVESIPIKDEASAAAAQEALAFFNQFSDTSATAYFSGIRLGRDQSLTYEEAVRRIRASKEAFVAQFPTFVNTVFQLVQLGGGDAAQLTDSQNGALEKGLNYVHSIYSSCELLAEVCHGRRQPTDEVFNTLHGTLDGLGSAVSGFTTTISVARVSLIKLFTDVLSIVPNVLHQTHAQLDQLAASLTSLSTGLSSGLTGASSGGNTRQTSPPGLLSGLGLG